MALDCRNNFTRSKPEALCIALGIRLSPIIVSYALERIEAHGDPLRAALESGQARIRPVLMTAAAMIMGMLPMALGGSTNAPLGRAVIGGLTSATVYTLFFVPCMYAIIYFTRSIPKDKESVPQQHGKRSRRQGNRSSSEIHDMEKLRKKIR